MDDEVQFSSCIWVKFECPCRSAIMSEVSLPPNKSFAHSVSGGSYIFTKDKMTFSLFPGQNEVD